MVYFVAMDPLFEIRCPPLPDRFTTLYYGQGSLRLEKCGFRGPKSKKPYQTNASPALELSFLGLAKERGYKHEDAKIYRIIKRRGQPSLKSGSVLIK